MLQSLKKNCRKEGQRVEQTAVTGACSSSSKGTRGVAAHIVEGEINPPGERLSTGAYRPCCRPYPPRPRGSRLRLARPHQPAAATTGHGHRGRGPRP
jgi:hypothetical protein